VYKVLPSQAVYPCGVIWTIPVEYLGSLFIYLTSYMFVHIPIHRYYVFFVLWFFCWWTMQWNGVFLLGLLIADLAQAGHIKRWKEWKYIWTVQLALVAIFFMMLCVDYVNRPIDTWTLSWQVQYGQLGGTAPWDQPKTTLIVAAFVEILLVEISGSLQWFFSTWPFVMLGKYSFGVYLVHGLVLYSVSTRVWVSLFNAGYDYCGLLALLSPNVTHVLTLASLGLGSIVVIGFIPYIITVFFAAWLFYYLLDKPSIALGHAVYRWGFVEDWTRENFKKGWDEYLDGWRDWGKERKAEWEWVKGKVCSCGKAEVDE
jgi:peptidoglycan/LPS O-acetylase OafA/YrhL